MLQKAQQHNKKNSQNMKDYKLLLFSGSPHIGTIAVCSACYVINVDVKIPMCPFTNEIYKILYKWYLQLLGHKKYYVNIH